MYAKLDNEAEVGSDTDAIGSPHPDIMIEDSMSEQIESAAREAGLDAFDYNDDPVVGSGDDDDDDDAVAGSDDDEAWSDNDFGDESLSGSDFDDVKSTNSDDMFGVYEKTAEEETESAVRELRLASRVEDDDAKAAELEQERIEQLERDEGRRARRRKEEQEKKAKLAEEKRKAEEARKAEEEMKLEEAKKAERDAETDWYLRAEKAWEVEKARKVEEARKAEEARKVEEDRKVEDVRQKQEQDALSLSQQSEEAAIDTSQDQQTRVALPDPYKRRYLEQLEQEREDELAWTESTNVQWTRHRDNSQSRRSTTQRFQANLLKMIHTRLIDISGSSLQAENNRVLLESNQTPRTSLHHHNISD
jgi:hypothetical protein